MNDSQTPLGSNRDRHAALGEGEIGPRGIGAFLSEPRFESLPALFEGPGVEGKGIVAEDMAIMKKLRANGLRARKRQKARAPRAGRAGRVRSSKNSGLWHSNASP